MVISLLRWPVSALVLSAIMQVDGEAVLSSGSVPNPPQPTTGSGFVAGPPISEEEKVAGKEKFVNETLTPEDKKLRDLSEPPALEQELDKDDRNAQRDVVKRWPNAVVPYEIEATFTEEERSIVAAAIANIEESTCVRFTPKQATDQDWAQIFKTGATGCWAYAGYIGPGKGARQVSLKAAAFPGDSSCMWKGIVVHELLHVIGFLHEQSRGDRDTYLTIDWTNIDINYASQLFKGTEDGSNENLPICVTKGATQGTNFDNCVSGSIFNTFDLAYDFQSVMHYDLYSFAIDRFKKVMVPKDPSITDADVGNTELSPLDKEKVNRAYFCDVTEKSNCGGYFNGTGGPLSGLGGSGELRCETILASTPEKLIKIDATINFVGTCDTDYLEVRQGTGLDSPLLGKYCIDNPLPPSLDTGSNPVILIWVTTSSTLTGTWSTVDAFCCNKVTLTSTDPEFLASSYYSALGGEYETHPTTPMEDGRKVYKKVVGDYCIFLNSYTQYVIYRCSDFETTLAFIVSNSGDLPCPQYARDWLWWNGTQWASEPSMRLECSDPPTTEAPDTLAPTTQPSTGCCKRREVAGIQYTFSEIDTISTLSDYNCLDNCVYKKNMAEVDRFCFKAGALEDKCLDEY